MIRPGIAAALAVVLTGCTGTGPGEEPSSEAGRPASSAPASGPASTDGPTPPATSAGPLTLDAFPAPDLLGPGWAYRVDPGDAEAGYVGNGTPGLARDPAEVVALAVPLGCPRPRLESPEHAFEVDYSWRDRPVVAIRLEFADASAAERFFDAREESLRDCVDRSGGTGVGPLVTRVDRVGATAVLSDRTPVSDGWTELAVRRDTGVLLLAAPTAFGAPPLRRSDAQDIQALLGEAR